MNKIIQKISLAMALTLLTTLCFAQGDKSQRQSPPDKVSKTVGNTTITIDYSQPSVKGRTIWGELVPFGKVWRTGANEATVFEVNKDVKIEGKTLKAGKYSLFTIPGEDEWTIIFNKQTGQWGTQYNEGEDELRVQVKPMKAPTMTEKMTFNISEKGKVSLMWENLLVDFNVTPAGNGGA